METGVITHMDGVITRPDCQLPDKTMSVYDRKAEKRRWFDWKILDRSMERIRTPLQQKAGTWEANSDHIIPEHTPLSDQRRAGTCVANAWCDMLEMLDGLEGKDKVEQLSRLFLYWTARYLTGDTDKDDGTYLRSAAHQLKKIGVVEEKYFPYSDDDRIFKSPELDLYTMASNNRISGFYKPDAATGLENYLMSLELSIRADHPIVFGTPISRDFTSARGMKVFGPPSRFEIVGHHAMIIVGVMYEGGRRLWLLRNSWGKHWGENGHIKVTDDYVLTFRDLWIGTRMEELV